MKEKEFRVGQIVGRTDAPPDWRARITDIQECTGYRIIERTVINPGTPYFDVEEKCSVNFTSHYFVVIEACDGEVQPTKIRPAIEYMKAFEL